AVLDVLNHVFVLVNLGQDLAAAQETLSGHKIKPQPVVKLSEGERLSFLVGSHPDVGHAAAVDEFLEVETSEGAGARRRRQVHFIVFGRGHVILSLNLLHLVARGKPEGKDYCASFGSSGTNIPLRVLKGWNGISRILGS